MTSNIKYSIVIPCFNEAKSLPSLVDRIKPLLERGTIEFILVDNGSSDDTQQIMSALLQDLSLLRSIRVEKNQGYGFGILSGLRIAKGAYVGWTHADMQTDPQDVLRVIDILEKYDPGTKVFAKGKRFGRPLADVLFTVGMSLFELILLGRLFWDINAQPNLMPRELYESWSNPPNDFSLDLYGYYQAKLSKAKIIRIPVFFGKRLHGTSHWNIDWKSKLKFIRRTINFSIDLRRSVRGQV